MISKNEHKQIEQIDDLQLLEIERTYRITTATWARHRPMMRATNGIVFFLDGRIRYNFEGEIVSAGAGDVLKLPRGAIYSGEKETPSHTFYVVDFETSPQTPFDAFALPRVFRPQSFDRTKQMFQGVLDAWNDSMPHGRLLCKARFYELLYELLREHRSQLPPLPGVLMHITAQIRQAFGEPSLNIAALAAEADISEAHLRRLFHRYLHTTPQDYLQETRLTHARNLLLNGLSVQETAVQCGYSSPFYFSRIFKQKTGYAPVEFKNQY